MFFTEIEISQYKCFESPHLLRLKQGINVIVGQNNVGKTSILEILETRFSNSLHLSVETFRSRKRGIAPQSSAIFSFCLSKDELLNILQSRLGENNSNFSFPLQRIPVLDSEFSKAAEYANARANLKEYFNNENFIFRLCRKGMERDYDNWFVPDDAYVLPKLSKATGSEVRVEHYIEFGLEPTDDFNFHQITQVDVGRHSEHRKDFARLLGQPLRSFIYRFRAERIPFAACPLGSNKTLASDASNLAEVLRLINPSQMNLFNKLVNEILPNIHQVGVELVGSDNDGQVKVWNQPDASRYDELGFTLNNCGSGVGQVLAICYVLLDENPKVILIDEPQSFLHPGAARKLLEVIRFYGKQHQIIIATHSPMTITASDPQSVALITQQNSKSEIVQVDTQEIKDLQLILAELGGRFSDVFGYDKVLWVEGETEELCFPKIAGHFQPLLGTAILRVQNTGDIDKKNNDFVQRIVSIYERLSSTNNGIVPTKIDFLFDRENRSETERKQLEKLGFSIQRRQCIHFTSRRLYENYLLNPDAIASVINEIDLARKEPLTVHEVTNWIEDHKSQPSFYANNKLPESYEEIWKNEIHGAKFLTTLFAELVVTEGVDFEKKKHSIRLTEWMLENAQDELKEISDLINKIVS